MNEFRKYSDNVAPYTIVTDAVFGVPCVTGIDAPQTKAVWFMPFIQELVSEPLHSDRSHFLLSGRTLEGRECVNTQRNLFSWRARSTPVCLAMLRAGAEKR